LQELDVMFEKQVQEQMKHVPKLAMPSAFQNIQLFEYQVQGIQWLVEKELHPKLALFYKEVTEKGRRVHFHFNNNDTAAIATTTLTIT